MGLFDRFYYGKAGKADYTPDDLPTTRWQLFWEVLRVRFWGLARLNLFQLVSYLPLVLWTAINFMALLNLGATDPETGAELASASFAQSQGLFMMYLVGLIPCILITGPFTAAATVIARNWARDQHCFLWSDYKDAFKANWKQGLATSALAAIAPALLYFVYIFYADQAAQTPLLVVPQMLVVVLAVVLVLALTLAYPLMVTYTLKFRQLWRNALLLSIGRLPFVLGLRLLTMLPLAIAVLLIFMGNLYGVLFAALYYAVIGFALHRFIYASYANSVFDKYINPRIEGAPVNLGLRAEDDEADEEEEP